MQTQRQQEDAASDAVKHFLYDGATTEAVPDKNDFGTFEGLTVKSHPNASKRWDSGRNFHSSWFADGYACRYRELKVFGEEDAEE